MKIKSSKSKKKKMKYAMQSMYNLNRGNKNSDQKINLKTLIDNVNGKIGVPILLYFLGVPGFFVVLIWAFFFRGK